ncbi:hypothetical protein [Tahibacter sp.]|uniref:hypothetical protein n=1 Tax=Tahibacter sp. TaxID=2056211 RepID=UPI0028C3AA79|nr:hypothetical protein [Tahibacter sp.]
MAKFRPPRWSRRRWRASTANSPASQRRRPNSIRWPACSSCSRAPTTRANYGKAIAIQRTRDQPLLLARQLVQRDEDDDGL